MRTSPRLISSGFFLLLAACSTSPEDRVSRAASRLNASQSPKVESARAEGRILIVRLRDVNAGNLSEEEVTKATLAGLCQMDEFKDLLKSGASLKLEVPRAWSYITINADHCDA